MTRLKDPPAQLDAFESVSAQHEAFERRVVRPVARPGNPQSRAARERVKAKAGWLREEIIKALSYGPLNDRELEQREVFAPCGPSTVRKRRGDLVKEGLVEKVGVRDGLSLWALKR